MSTVIGTFVLLLAPAAPPGAGEYFTIEVVDEQTGRGVPLVELRTVDGARYYTDSAGIVAFREPELMGQKVFFYITSHGYEYPADGFGFHGKTLDVKPGGRERLAIKRTNVAERLYRATGEGIYRDSVLVGRAAPIKHPLLNAQVSGSDSVQSVVYRGRLFWFWGDTNRPRYPLGNFQVPGATSRLPADGGLDPSAGVELAYFVDDEGFAKRTCEMPGDGPTWIDGLSVVKNAAGEAEMYAAYVKVRGFLNVYKRGLARFDDSREQFVHVAEFDMDAPVHPHGHTFHHAVDGADYIYFGNPYPLVRVRAHAAAIADLSAYEAFTCLTPGSRLKMPRIPGINVLGAKVDRDSSGAVHWAWKKNAPPVMPEEQASLITTGKLREGEALYALRDIETDKPVKAHAGSVAWNDYRKAWTMIAEESGGTSALGEIWYAEADAPRGPWVFARKVVTHEKYSFYNPRQHPALAQDGGRLVYFEGTYSTFFSGNDHATPRYDYNQIMYRLDLADPWLSLPAPVYRTRDESGHEGLARATMARHANRGIAFFAAVRPGDGLVPVFAAREADGDVKLSLSKPEGAGEAGEPLFYALPAEGKELPASTAPLYEHTDAATGATIYSTDDAAKPFVRSAKPLCRVWRSPIKTIVVWE
ncbi:MAG: hypothetical protein HYX69_08220 [Planctomycetia bacterium]|nr:hypothetical protein [Planctomycetia bacterium]